MYPIWEISAVARMLQLSVLAGLLACCATQPSEPGRRSTPSLPTAPAVPGVRLRIGVEFLPPESDHEPELPIADVSPTLEPSMIAAQDPARRRSEPELPNRDAQHTWSMSASDLAAVDEPIARETVRFVDDMMREDDRAGRRELRRPFLDYQPVDIDGGPLLWSEEQCEEAHAEWVHANGPSLLRKPARQLLRRLPLVREIELEFEDFRSGNVPLSEPYQAVHGDPRRLGRLSLRVHARDLQDPVEVVYILGGVRIGSSQNIGKVSLDWQLSEQVSLQVRASTDYQSREHRLRADLSYWASSTTSLHLCVGDDLDFLSTTSIYSLFDSPMDGSPGILLYAVHSF